METFEELYKKAVLISIKGISKREDIIERALKAMGADKMDNYDAVKKALEWQLTPLLNEGYIERTERAYYRLTAKGETQVNLYRLG